MLLKRIKQYSQRAGKEVLAVAEATYLTAKDPDIPVRHKTLLLGAITYLLSPLDGVPDFLPGGFADDLSLLLAALAAAGPIGKHHHEKCRIKYGLIEAPNKEESES